MTQIPDPNDLRMRLNDRVAIITGGARGIGRAAVELFHHEGAVVVIWDVLEVGSQTASEVGVNEPAVSFIQVDTSDVSQVEKAAQQVFDQYGKIDILINNAGITRDKSFLKMTHEHWQQVINVNLGGVFNCTKAIAPYMVEAGYGRVVSTSSIVGIRGNFGQTNYAAAKAGIIGMTKTWAIELGKHGITANAVAPGFIKSDMTDEIPDEVKEESIQKIPVRRMGYPTDIANAYLFLALEESSFVNGHCLGVNGGVA